MNDRRRLGRPETPEPPAVSRQLAADRYWQLRLLVSEALRARDRVTFAQQAHLAAQAKVDDAIKAAGLDPAQVYSFDDTTQQLTPMPIGGASAPPLQVSLSPLSMLDGE